HDKANSRKQLPDVKLYLRHDSSRCLPTGRLIEKALVSDHWLVARPSHGPCQQLRNIPLQAIVGWDAAGILYAPLLECFVNLQLGKGRVRTESNLIALRLLTLD